MAVEAPEQRRQLLTDLLRERFGSLAPTTAQLNDEDRP